MKTFLLTWNPKRTQWRTLPNEARMVAKKEYVWGEWNVAAHRLVQPHDRVFLLRVGKNNPGIMASGEVSSWPESGKSWDRNAQSHERTVWYVELKWNALLPPGASVFPRSQLQRGILRKMNWATRRSGVPIPQDVARALRAKWQGFLERRLAASPAADVPTEKIPKRLRKEVSRLVRDTRVTAEIKELYGWTCQLCGKRLRLSRGKYYAEGHHLKPLGRQGNGPDIKGNVVCVCPNCHALLDYHAVRIRPTTLKLQRHRLGRKYIDFHNRRCR